jgi:pyruvate kinase
MCDPAVLLASRPSQTKIVATVGPACQSEAKLAELIEVGVDVFRLNTAHGDQTQHQARLDAIRRVSRELGRPVAVLVDLAGPKMRLGELPDGQIQLERGQTVRFVRGQPQSPGDLSTTYEPLVDELAPGNRVMLADGTVSLVVDEVGRDGARCRVVQGGVVRSRQGVNLPGARLSAAALGEADWRFAAWAARQEVDFLGLSFVRAAAEVRELKAFLTGQGACAQVVAKIEKPEALERLEEIVDAADAIMVARGDLGVEIDIARVAVVQKEIIALCVRRHKPVIIATQMLDSMQHARIPTRAEVTDVANAILDGADACMLSGETAIGEYPREAVEMMHRIALATESVYRRQPPAAGPDFSAAAVHEITEAVVHSAARLAAELRAKMVVVASASGTTARLLSKNRTFVPTVGVSQSEATLRRMCLYWGVIPLPGAPASDSAALLQFVADRGVASGALEPGDRIVLVAGTGLAVTAHNLVVVHEVA